MRIEENSSADKIAQTYVRLVLSIDRHYPGYVDGYYGPAAWKSDVCEGDPLPLADLLKEAEELADVIAASPDLDAQRRDYLAHEVLAAQTTLRLLQGEPLSLAEEVAGVYDLNISWTRETIFEELRYTLGELLPGDGSLAERYKALEESLKVPPVCVEPLARYAVEELRGRTDALFHLPPGDGVELIFPDADEPWAGYHDYRGNHQSRIAINTHWPQRLSNFIHIIAHEAYPGHHTEHSLKEASLTRGLGRAEHYVVMANSPSCVISEGAAMNALETAFTESELVDWFEQEIYPRARLEKLDAHRQLEVARTARRLERLFGNAVILMYDRCALDEEVYAYMRRYSPELDENLRAMLEFMKDRLRRSYTFCYAVGTQLMEELFAARGDRACWYLRAISEPVTPSQVRQWIGGV